MLGRYYGTENKKGNNFVCRRIVLKGIHEISVGYMKLHMMAMGELCPSEKLIIEPSEAGRESKMSFVSESENPFVTSRNCPC